MERSVVGRSSFVVGQLQKNVASFRLSIFGANANAFSLQEEKFSDETLRLCVEFRDTAGCIK
jgi:hypothetical protein